MDIDVTFIEVDTNRIRVESSKTKEIFGYIKNGGKDYKPLSVLHSLSILNTIYNFMENYIVKED